ncbi:MAG: hypothetical protein HN742_38170 [Lentisphaerae bacterium]|nr:hypothetical protein [Lentisphaerota bacterium]MBT4821110.1 hypothetical protein [Lentisphaerota bacterium]MBT5604984.1 hypothetical protein [Lentisphaerota bacterium]MBT7055406.1 hypothetical protein [Lentisphaerota bacterium]MBT7847756.1 hypothetical protein [Lentisphaerota bacterium]
MTSEIRKLLVLVAGAAILTAPAFAWGQNDEAKKDDKVEIVEDAADAAAEEVDEKDIQNKLLKLTTLEDAFKKALRNNQLLQRYIVQENAKVEATEDEEAKQAARKNIGAAQKKLQTNNVAMNIVFGLGRRRTYQYDEVSSTIYLRVGTVEEAFARTVRTRDLLRNFVVQQKALLEAEKDEEKKAEIQAKVDNGTRQYGVVAAALQVIYGVNTQRSYEYNPKNATLYLKISENELDKIKVQISELQEKQKAAAEEAGTEAPAEAAKE